MLDQSSHEADLPVSESPQGTRPIRFKTRCLKWIRRVHLYAGLFLLPWVFLYGITGAMFNHYTLFPAADITPVTTDSMDHLNGFPTASTLAEEVVSALQQARSNHSITLRNDHQAAFNNDMIFESRINGRRHNVHINPADHSAHIMVPPINQELEDQSPLLKGTRQVSLPNNPYDLARAAVPEILKSAGHPAPSPAKPLGWCKLNFLADIDGQPARVTYVLRDGHVDITRYTGEDGMITRAAFLRLHSFHGRTPSWSARNLWSFFIDAMALAMVMWGITGVVMWWQMKRLRRIGGVVLAMSVLTALGMYYALMHFHAITKM